MGGRPARYALLNEHQATLLLALSKNSYKVVKLKVALVLAFKEMKEALTQSQDLLSEVNTLSKKLENEKEVASEHGRGLARWREKRDLLENRIGDLKHQSQLMLNFNS